MVYISSHNIISSLGFNSDENLINISDNITGIKITNDLNLSPESVAVSLVNTEELNSGFSQISNTNKYTRFEKLLILSINDALTKTNIDIKNSKTLLIISTTKGNIDLLQKDKLNSFEAERVQLWKSSEIIKDFFNHPNKAVTVSNACISGLLSIIVAKRLIEAGKYDHAVVAGADILPEFTLSGFQAFKAVSEGACKPFDKDRSGMTPGEGAGTIILTNDKNKASKPYIQITGETSSNDANHISGPSRTGEELAISINKSLKEAGINSQNIDYISAHGTATLFNDEMETKALKFSGLNNVPVNSIKGYLGHTFGAAGIIETIVAISSLTKNKLYKSLGYNEQGTDSKINIITENIEVPVNNILKTASGFGGCNASLVISKENKSKSQFKKTEYKIEKKVKLYDNRLFIDDEEVKTIESNMGLSFSKYAKEVYKSYGIKYPKYYKMDNLSKLAFLSSEILLKNIELLKKYKEDEIAVILSNGSSSLDTDVEYQQTINDRDNYFPSPSVFVYTLANVMIGEICIRNKIKGENTIFISKDFNKEFIFDYADILFKTGKTKACITGRIEFNYPNGNYDAELYLLESKNIG